MYILSQLKRFFFLWYKWYHGLFAIMFSFSKMFFQLYWFPIFWLSTDEDAFWKQSSTWSHLWVYTCHVVVPVPSQHFQNCWPSWYTSRVPYVGNISGLSILNAPSVFSNIYLDYQKWPSYNHGMQTSIININKTLALLQTTGGKDVSSIVLCGNRNVHHNKELRT
jgi:hypothetical protein